MAKTNSNPKANQTSNQTSKASKANQGRANYQAPSKASNRARLEDQVEALKEQLRATLKAPKAPKADQAPKAPKAVKLTAKVVELVPGIEGKVKHNFQFEGQALNLDLQAASKSGDSYILNTAQLSKAAIQAIDKALSYLPSHKGQGWKLDNLQIIPN